MAEAVLFVDDEPAVLDGYKRMLYRSFAVQTAVGGAAGLATMRDQGPFAVVVSDMRMPGMSGAEFLQKARGVAPGTVRILLTGYSDTQDAAAAVNDGNIFRYLNKPCGKEDLSEALTLGLERYRMQMAERELLEGTLLGCIRALAEVLSAVNPEAFERSNRVSACVRHLLARMTVSVPWQVEAAAMLSQLGCLALPPELLRTAHLGKDLAPAEQARFDAHPAHASEMVAHIPRMDAVGRILERQIYRPQTDGGEDTEQVQLAGEMLRLAVAYDTLWLRGLPHATIVFELRQALHTFPTSLLNAVETMKPVERQQKPAWLPVSRLVVDMVINEDVRNGKGALLVGAGQPITRPMLMKLREYVENRTITDEIGVLVIAGSALDAGAC